MSFSRHHYRTILFAALILLGGEVPSWAGPKWTVGKNIPSGQRVSMDRIDHARFDRLLRKYVDGQGNVNYSAWKKSRTDQTELDAYLDQLSYADPSARASNEGKLAFWINAYNAATIKGILREYPTTSIRNHTARVFGYNIWHDLLVQVGGSQYSLDSIEHKVLRKMGEPRVHFAIVCASISCPRLLNQAYTSGSLDQQLTTNTKNFFANPLHFRHDVSARRFQLSSILSWFGEDFGSGRAAQLAAIAPYLPTAESQRAAKTNSVSISYLDYNWNLNDQTTARAARR